ncbi:MAG TPA: DUF4351 domain-containing protein [Thermoanaerobaculia bacterium]|jgi:predicted transposase YdaD|nr:DUF4351 domain-containing protein [Thermoanaerobaculia bacterium]
MPPEHDRLFKTLLRAFFPGFLYLVVPDLAERLDAARASFLDKELLAEEPALGKREADLLARVPIRDDGVLLVHVEIEARASSQMPHRLRAYAGRIQAAYGEQVLSILVNLKGGPAGIRQATLENALSSPELSLFRYVVFGLARSSGAAFLAQSEPVGWALAALMSRGKASRPAYKLACQKRILTARLTGVRRTALLDFVEAYLELTPAEVTEYKVLSKRNRRGTREMWMTWSEKQKAEGKREGLKEGKREGARSVLLHLLNQRFGPLPERVQRQVEAINSLRRLTRLAEQVLVVGSLRELRLR